MKTVLRSLALAAVLGFASLTPVNSAVGACRYACSNPFQIFETYVGPTCCSQTFTCPNGQTVYPYGYQTVTGWKFCGPIW